MKSLLILFFAAWAILGLFIVARWYLRAHSSSSNKDGGAHGVFDGDSGGDCGSDGGDGGGDGGGD